MAEVPTKAERFGCAAWLRWLFADNLERAATDADELPALDEAFDHSHTIDKRTIGGRRS